MNNNDKLDEVKKRIANAFDARISILKGIANTKPIIKRNGGIFNSFDYMIGDISGWARGYAEGLIVGRQNRPITEKENEEIRSFVKPYEEEIRKICSTFTLE